MNKRCFSHNNSYSTSARAEAFSASETNSAFVNICALSTVFAVLVFIMSALSISGAIIMSVLSAIYIIINLNLKIGGRPKKCAIDA